MSKQTLSSLSSLIPIKGEAAKIETLPEEKPRLSKPLKEERHGLTIRIRQSHNERLRTMVYREGMTKQDLLDRAIEEMLERYGY